MSDAPERIWRCKPWAPSQYKHGLASWPRAVDAGPHATEYVRADIADGLLAALEDVLDGIGFLSGGDHELEGFGISQDRAKEIRAAIAKAKGQALTRAEPRASMAEQFEAEMSSAADRKKSAKAKGQP